MKKETDVIIERSEKGLCPICKKPMGVDFKVEEYKNKKIWICRIHPIKEMNK